MPRRLHRCCESVIERFNKLSTQEQQEIIDFLRSLYPHRDPANPAAAHTQEDTTHTTVHWRDHSTKADVVLQTAYPYP